MNFSLFIGGMFPGSHFLLHPYRKPKRIRTAFNPNQLLKLEEAFEKNQYVVGAERKQLAASLNLTETQVTGFLKIIPFRYLKEIPSPKTKLITKTLQERKEKQGNRSQMSVKEPTQL